MYKAGLPVSAIADSGQVSTPVPFACPYAITYFNNPLKQLSKQEKGEAGN
jgi:hypothetical protein